MLVRYLYWLLLMPVAICIPVAAINRAVDPIGIFSSQYPGGLTHGLLASSEYERPHKAYRLLYVQPETIILGTSRADIGLRPEHPGWRGESVYNAGLQGATEYEIMRYFEHAHALGKLKHVLLTADFGSFISLKQSQAGFQEKWLLRRPIDVPQRLGLEWQSLGFMLSLSTMRESLAMLFTRHALNSAGPLGNGRLQIPDDLSPAQDSVDAREAFIEVETGVIRNIYKPYVSLSDDEKARLTTGYLDNFRHILGTAYQDNLEVQLVISPVHARDYEIMHLLGMRQDYESWKRSIVMSNENLAEKYGRKQFPVVDYTSMDSYNDEPLPPAHCRESRCKMHWFLDLYHYTPALGDIVLDQVLLGKVPSGTSHYGREISSGNLEQGFQNINLERANWELRHPKDVEYLRGVIAQKNWN